ncbi:MAG: threonine synthase, partial [Duncaniella sp.]|nr:threonine synthase [Duncaniella sp.]
DGLIAETMADCYKRTGYILDPHGAVAYRALRQLLLPGETGVFLETAHPAKFKDTVEAHIGAEVEIPERLADFMKGTKQSVEMSKDFSDFRTYLASLE